MVMVGLDAGVLDKQRTASAMLMMQALARLRKVMGDVDIRTSDALCLSWLLLSLAEDLGHMGTFPLKGTPSPFYHRLAGR